MLGADVTDAIPVFMQYGAMGILALGFIVLLILFWRSDKRAAGYAATIKDATQDRTILIGVVRDNTRAITSLTAQISSMEQTHQRTASVIEEFGRRLDNEKCPLLNGGR